MEFVEKVYGNYMQHIKHNLIQKKAAENDETYYLWAVQFFTSFNQQLFLKLDNLAETLSTSTVHFIQILITSYHDKLKVEKNKPLKIQISRRLHLGIRAYREILILLKSIQRDSEFWDTSEKIKKNIYTDKDYNCLLLNSFQEYEEHNYCREFLEDLIVANDIFLDSINEFGAEHFTARYCNPHVIKSYVDILKSFKTNTDQINLAVLKFMKRIVFECHQETILMQISIFKCLLKIMDYKLIPEHEQYVSLTQHLIEKFGAMANKKRWMYQELLFLKSMNDVVEIENAVDPPQAPQEAARNEQDDDPLDDILGPMADEQPADENVETQAEEQEGEKQDRSQSLDDLLAELGSDSSNHSEKAPEPRQDSNFDLDLSSDESQQVPSEPLRLFSSSSDDDADDDGDADGPKARHSDKANAFTISDDEDDNDNGDDGNNDNHHVDNDNDNHQPTAAAAAASDESSLSDFPDVSDASSDAPSN